MSSGGYDFGSIEAKWQAYWLERKTFKSSLDRSKPKYYVLDMFPYPSGSGLHVGHPEGYTATDIMARYKRMKGFNVLHPMGWDAFGLPAERHAMRTGEHPAVITNQNCDTFRRQIQALGLSYDWDREINTTDPKYVKWTQWIFQVLFERGLAYQTEAPVNWCPALATVLANEEVKDGKYVETGDPVEKRMMKQWMLRITAYAERLLEDLDDLDWPEGIKAMQREWIGRSEGADVEFKVADGKHAFTVYTTRPDTLFGATFCVLGPEHPLVGEIASAEQRDAVVAYVEASKSKSAQDRTRDDREKTGVFTGAHAINPVTGAEIPIWVADYVLGDYGYGAIMAVPAQDERDWAFAEKYDLPIVRTVQPPEEFDGKAFVGDGPAINSDFLNGLHVAEAKRAMIAHLEKEGLGKGTVNYRLRDWLFSRQRYWGEPFPLIELEGGTVKAVPMTDLPIALPKLDEYKPTADGQPPLARAVDWVNTTDPETGQPAKRETNTMPQWAGSCWYFLRFVDPTNDTTAWSKEAEEYWMPVDLYIGGAEHAVLHLLYSRFWHKVLYDAGHVHTKEPFQKLFNQGMILAYSYQDSFGKYYYPHEARSVKLSEHLSKEEKYKRSHVTTESYVFQPLDMPEDYYWYEASTGREVRIVMEDIFWVDSDGNAFSELEITWEPTESGKIQEFHHRSDNRRLTAHLALHTQIEKMSKSRYNVVNPDEVIKNYGADSMRLYEMFMGPLDRDKPWTDEGVQGVHRFLRRAWSLFIGEDGKLSTKIQPSGGDAELEKILHKTIKAVGDDTEKMYFNTAIARMMEFVNAGYKAEVINKDWAEKFVLCLAPYAAHIAEELWERLGHSESLAYAPWPDYDAALLVEDTIEFPVQVNGKMRAKLYIPKDLSQADILAAAKAEPNVAAHLEGKTLVKEIVVPGRMVNLVVK